MPTSYIYFPGQAECFRHTINLSDARCHTFMLCRTWKKDLETMKAAFEMDDIVLGRAPQSE